MRVVSSFVIALLAVGGCFLLDSLSKESREVVDGIALIVVLVFGVTLCVWAGIGLLYALLDKLEGKRALEYRGDRFVVKVQNLDGNEKIQLSWELNGLRKEWENCRI